MTSQECLGSQSTGENISLEHGGGSDTEAARNYLVNAPRETQSDGDGEVVSHGIVLGWRFYLIFASLAVASLAAALDSTSLTVALPVIADDLHGTGIEVFWAGTSYLLTSTIVQPTFASLSHIFGRKPLLLAALVFFLLGAIVSAASKQFAVLLVGRSFQGMGAGGIVALGDIVVTDLVELRLRGKWFGYLSIMWAIGSTSGPVIGGAFAQKGLWRWIFWINLPLGAAALAMAVVFLKLHQDRSTMKQKLKRVDWVGAAWFMASATSILIPLSWGGVVYPWNDWRTLVPLLLGVAGLFLLVYWELHVAVEALFRLSIFRTLTAKVTFFTAFLHGLIIFLQLYYLPLYFEAVKEYSPVITGLSLFPQTLTIAPAALFVGILITVTGSYRWMIWIGWALTTLGTGLMYLLDVHTSIPAWIFINLTSGPGIGFLFPAMAFAVQGSVQNEDIAFAVAAYSFFRSFGSAFGVAVGGVIFQNELKKKLLAYPLLAPYAEAYSKDAPTLVQIIKGMGGQPDKKAQLIQAFADSLKVIWLLACGVSGFALIVSLAVKGYSLDIVLKTQQGLVRETEGVNMEKGPSKSPPSTLAPPTSS